MAGIVWPNGLLTQPHVTSPYGPRLGGVSTFHNGVDFDGFSTVKAVMGGKVTFAGWLTNAAGWTVSIDVQNLNGVTTTHVYMHLAKGSFKVSVGQSVGAGAALGTLGMSGNATGPCVHFEVRFWQNGEFTTTEPVAWVRSRLASTAGGIGSLTPTQRVTVAVTNGRTGPSSKTQLSGEPLQANTVGNFIGWIRGESVSGNNVWFKGTSERWFWSGGFKDGAKTTGLTDLNPVPASPDRTVRDFEVNGRSGPGTQFPIKQVLASGTKGTFDGYATGEKVTIGGTTSDVWFRGSIGGNWFAAAGFTSQAVTGLTLVTNPPTSVEPTPPPTLPPTTPPPAEYAPVYPGAAKGYVAPLGDGVRATNNIQPGVSIIDRFIIHHTATKVDQLSYFSYKNDRSSCPTWYVRADGTVLEMIRPKMKPASTGPTWNWRSVSVETQNTTTAPTWGISPASRTAIAKAIAWLAEYDGKTLDGTPVSFKIDATHVIGHSTALPGTECPGPEMHVDAIIAEAKAIYAANHPAPIPTPPSLKDQIKAKSAEIRKDLDELDALVALL
jgi:murein DD-endopeptidase MepM/ murein hydrolase activator NlpD